MGVVDWEYSNVKLYSQAEMDAALLYERERCAEVVSKKQGSISSNKTFIRGYEAGQEDAARKIRKLE